MPASCAALTTGHPPKTRPVLVYDVEAGHPDLQFGTGKPRIEFDKLIPAMEGGKFAHVVGFVIQYLTRFDTATAGMTAVMQGQLILGLGQNIQMNSGGRQLFRGAFDFRRLFFDTRAKIGGSPIALPTSLPDADATDVERLSTVRFLFGAASKGRGRRDAYDGAIPMSMLDSRKRSNDVLTWQWASALPTAPAGVTLDSLRSCRVWALVAYSSKPRLGPLPYLDEIVETSQQVTVERMYQDAEGAIDYASVAYVEEDSNGTSVSTLGTFDVRVADAVVASAETVTERQEGWKSMLYLHGEDLSIPNATDATTAGTNNNLGFLEQLTPPFVPLVVSPPNATKRDMADGPLLVNVSSLGSQTRLRILCRSYTEPPPEWKRDALLGFGLNPDDPDLVAVAQRSAPGKSGRAALVDVAIERKSEIGK